MPICNLLTRNSLRHFSSKPIFQLAVVIQRSPILQSEKTAFETAYQDYFYDVERELSRGPFKLSLGLLSEADSKTTATLQSNEPDQISLKDADEKAMHLLQQANTLPFTDPNRRPNDKLFLVLKMSHSESWQFPSIAYTDSSFETPLHRVSSAD